MKEIESYYPQNKQEWREWLATHHIQKEAVWVIFYKQKTGKPTLTWSEAVDEALCFGWIDSVKKTLDEERFIQYFSKRKPKSTWSKVNKEKVEQLIAKELMMPAGLKCIEIAKQNGSWEILDSVEALIIPEDLENALKSNENAMESFLNLSKSVRKILLHQLVFAKREETRQKRINQILELVMQANKPK